GRVRLHLRPRVEALAAGVRHLAGDKDKIVADYGWDEARTRRRGDTGGIDFLDLGARAGGDGDQRGPDRAVGTEASLHDPRGARRDVVAELGVPRQMIRVHRLRGRVVLVEPYGVPKIGAELAQDAAHPSQDEIRFAAAARATEHRKSRRPRDLL